jgi:tetratricopeptide (TPR) repeat protein
MPWRGLLSRPERRFFDATQRAYKLTATLPEERMDMSWVTLDRICQEKADREGVPRELVRDGRPLRSSADALSDDELLAKLRELGLDVDRDGVDRLCARALSAEEVAGPIARKLKLDDDMVVDWVWISLLALWQRWWPDRVCRELLDDKMQAGYVQDAENDPHAAAVTWLDAWADVLRLCDAADIGSIGDFDDRFPLTQSLFNWSQDLEMALENAGRDDGEIRQALIEFCEESLRRFPNEDQLLTENRRRALGGAYFDAGMSEKAGELFRSWLDADPGWGWGWIGWADCYLPWGGRTADFVRAEELLSRGYRVPGVRDRAEIAERLKEMCEDSGRPDEARQFGEQAKRLRQEHLRPAARPVLSQSAGQTRRRVKVGRNDPCPCGSGKKFKKCCGSPAAEVR